MNALTPADSSAAEVIIVGAGMAGIMAARCLLAAGVKPVIIEAGAEAGGRLATRQVGRAVCDSGAQFFTTRTERFRVEVEAWMDAAVVFEWSRGWPTGSLSAGRSDGFPRYAAHEGFSSLAKSLARDLEIVRSTLLNRVEFDKGNWVATDSSGRRWISRAIILTPPVPLSLTLLERGRVAIAPQYLEMLTKINYSPCLSGLFELDGHINLPEPGGLQNPDGAISWIADNHRKGISPEGRGITVHAGRGASRHHWFDDDYEILEWMAAEIRTFFAPGTQIVSSHMDRWPYAVPELCYPERCIAGMMPGPIAFAGDAFDGPRVEGAALSGMAAADELIGLL